jgi:hypothetical protein
MSNPNPSPKTRFKKGQVANPKGQKGGMRSRLKKLTVETYREVIQMVVNGDVEALQMIIKDPTQPAIKVAVATSFATAIKKGDFQTIELILSRLIGKVPDVILTKNENVNVNLEPNKEKVKALLAKIESEI